MRRFAPLTWLAAAVACGVGPRPGARPAPVPVRLAVRASIDSLLADPMFRNANWGVLIVDPLLSDTLYARNAGRLFMPASNQKLLTGATALAQLGPDYRFVTSFWSTGPIEDGTLRGDLVVSGTGDPTFSDSMRAGDYRNAFRDMADSISAHGIARIAGLLRKGADAFPDGQRGFGWEFDDMGTPSGAGVDELFVNEGVAKELRRRPNGDTASVSVAIREPELAFFGELRDALARRGIFAIGGFFTYAPYPDTGLGRVFTLQSVPLRDILPRMMKPSQNQIAEILYKTLGREKAGVGSADSARSVVQRQLVAWGADSSEFSVRDGSGLSRHDYVTPETIVRVLDAMRRHPDFRVFYDALPVGGVDGTLATRMRDTPAQGNAHAKTGTVDKARSLSGYVTTDDGRLLLFSFLCNNFTVPNREVERVQDVILARLAGARLRGP